MSSPEILLIDDDRRLADMVGRYLGQAGFAVQHQGTAREGLAALGQQVPGLVLLDLMLPGRDGIDICREIRTFSSVPIIMMTARVEEIDRLLGLELGADDYICKPFSPREMVARVRAVLRRTLADAVKPQQKAVAEAVLEKPADVSPPPDGLWIDTVRHAAWLEGSPLELTPVEFRLLSVLAAMPGHVFSREDLLERLYEDQRVVNGRTVDTHVKNLRRKMGRILPDSDLIQSVYGMGYKYQP